MRKLLFFTLCFVVTNYTFAQKKSLVNTYLSGQANKILYDKFAGFTFTGFGAGLQLKLNTDNKLKPQIDITGNLFPINKIAFILPDSTITGPKQSVATIFIGFVYEAKNQFEAGLSCGMTIHDYGRDLGLKPYAAYYLGKKKIIKAYVALTHIFVRNNFSKNNTGIIGAGLAVKLF